MCNSCNINDLKTNILNWSGNEKIDNFIQEMQLRINSSYDDVPEWIPYDQLNDIKEIHGKGGLITIYSAVWKDGPLCYNYDEKKWKREPDLEINLKCLHNNVIDDFLNEV